MEGFSDIALKVFNDFTWGEPSSFTSLAEGKVKVYEDRVRYGTTRYGVCYVPFNEPKADLVNKTCRVDPNGKFVALDLDDDNSSLIDDIKVKDDKKAVFTILNKQFLELLQNGMKCVALDSTFFNRFIFEFYDNKSFTFMGVDRGCVYCKNYGDTANALERKFVFGWEYDKVLHRNLVMFLESFQMQTSTIKVSSKGMHIICNDMVFYIAPGLTQFDFNFLGRFHLYQNRKFEWKGVSALLEKMASMKGKRAGISLERLSLSHNACKVINRNIDSQEDFEYDVPVKFTASDVFEKFEYKNKSEFFLMGGLNCVDFTKYEISVNASLIRLVSSVFGDNLTGIIAGRQYLCIEKIKELNSEVSWF